MKISAEELRIANPVIPQILRSFPVYAARQLFQIACMFMPFGDENIDEDLGIQAFIVPMHMRSLNTREQIDTAAEQNRAMVHAFAYAFAYASAGAYAGIREVVAIHFIRL